MVDAPDRLTTSKHIPTSNTSQQETRQDSRHTDVLDKRPQQTSGGQDVSEECWMTEYQNNYFMKYELRTENEIE